MPSKATQKNRSLAIETALGADALVLRSIALQEQLGRPFNFEIELSSEDGEVKFDDLIGTNATIRLELPEKATRYFNGIVSRLSQGANKGGLAHYRATLVPWLWLLTRTADCRIFQNKSVPDIIEAVFKGHDLNDYELKLSETHGPREYCVQYRETDFNFVSRLMEQEGIYYYFKHENAKHIMVLADAISAHAPFTGYEEVTYSELEKGADGQEAITDWQIEKQVQPGAYVLNDFDFIKPKASLLAVANVTRNHAGSAFEIFDYPGDYVKHSDGEYLAKVRLDEYQSKHEVCRGQSSAKGLSAGCTFSLKKHGREDQNREYLITAVSLQAEAGEYASGGKDEGDYFSCGLEAIDKVQPFRAPQTTPKPIVQGPQTAMVVGPKGEEIHVDEHGRVKVSFPWDRYSTVDENSSCWIRVSQSWAGKKWGSIYTPRIGQEVIVEFLEGDPDRPIITGRVYNGEAKPPYELPAEKTKSTLKSNSSKGGGGFNEIRFEDKKDSEQVFIHAQKDMDVRVANDLKEIVGSKGEGCLHLIVKKDQFEKIEGEKHQTVKGNQFSSNDGDVNRMVKGDQMVKVDGGDHLEVKGDQCIKITGDASLAATGKTNQKSTGDYALESGGKIHIKAGMTLVIEAGTQISLKVGGNFIDIGPAGVSIKGTMVNINSGGAAGSGGGCSPTAPEAPEAAKEPKEAASDKAGEVDEAPKAPKPPKPVKYSSQAKVMKQAAEDGTPFCEECEKAKQQQAGAIS